MDSMSNVTHIIFLINILFQTVKALYNEGYAIKFMNKKKGQHFVNQGAIFNVLSIQRGLKVAQMGKKAIDNERSFCNLARAAFRCNVYGI